jgi:hypothetical protein
MRLLHSRRLVASACLPARGQSDEKQQVPFAWTRGPEPPRNGKRAPRKLQVGWHAWLRALLRFGGLATALRSQSVGSGSAISVRHHATLIQSDENVHRQQGPGARKRGQGRMHGRAHRACIVYAAPFIDATKRHDLARRLRFNPRKRRHPEIMMQRQTRSTRTMSLRIRKNHRDAARTSRSAGRGSGG